MSERKPPCPICRIQHDDAVGRCPRCDRESHKPDTRDRPPAGPERGVDGPSSTRSGMVGHRPEPERRYLRAFEAWKQQLRACKDFRSAFKATDAFAQSVAKNRQCQHVREIVPHLVLLSHVIFIRSYMNGAYYQQEKIIDALYVAGYIDLSVSDHACSFANRFLVEELRNRGFSPWVLALETGDFTVLADPENYPGGI